MLNKRGKLIVYWSDRSGYREIEADLYWPVIRFERYGLLLEQADGSFEIHPWQGISSVSFEPKGEA